MGARRGPEGRDNKFAEIIKMMSGIKRLGLQEWFDRNFKYKDGKLTSKNLFKKFF